MIEFARADYGQEERDAVKRVLDSDWLASGTENTNFEKEFASYVGAKYSVCCNSGSSANLLALASLNLPRGAKVLTSACGFPATLSPILHLGYVPVLVDYDFLTHNIDIEQVIHEIRRGDISAIIFAHTMGSPVDVDRIVEIADEFGVRVIEDCCEAVGSIYKGKQVGTFGDLGTYSFYPAHQITALGEGGMIVTNSETFYHCMMSMRDWGKMYGWNSGQGGNVTDYNSPINYHRGYTYETVGWNFKLCEASAAFGREQLKKLDGFRKNRAEAHWLLMESLGGMKEFMTPLVVKDADPCWFGFILTIKDREKINRNDFGAYLERRGIRHRPFFAGNLTKHKPFYKFVSLDRTFSVADKLMKDSLFIGCHTKVSGEDIHYIGEKIHAYCSHT